MGGYFNLDWYLITAHLAKMATAYILSLPIAWNREAEDQSAGLRTFPLVAVASCGFMLIGIEVFASGEAQARVVQGIITGIGFIGGGAIIKTDKTVTGTATATSIWSTGAIGIAVAWGRFEVAVLLSLLTFITLKFVYRLKGQVHRED
ncbi:MAG: MgtC/SapB family protein [Pseudomonadales bacterium]|nr:MgtC/SapB family protein [Pseudomonadales bacterium]